LVIPFELDILERGHEYQKWVIDSVKPFLGKRILEAGAGIGNMSRWLPAGERLIITETETQLVPVLEDTIRKSFGNSKAVSVRQLDLASDWASALASENPDTIVSFNVMEHIVDDARALSDFARLLRSSHAQGPRRIITFAPAHGWAFGSMDRAYGHSRRYTLGGFRKLAAASAPGFSFEGRYFNLFGLPGWLLMSFVLRKQALGLASVLAFENACPRIRHIDDFLHQKLHIPFGQSILTVLTLK